MKSSQKKNKGIRVPSAIVVGLFIVLILGVGLTGAVAWKLQSLTKDSVGIVTRPSETTSPPAPTTSATETQLPAIDGMLMDIDVDYVVDVADLVEEPSTRWCRSTPTRSTSFC